MRIVFLLLVLFVAACSTTEEGPRHVPRPGTKYVDYIIMEKSANRLSLLKNGKVVRQFHAALGFNPLGHKQEEGDGRTPEGIYEISFKNAYSKFYRSLKISYPNDADIESAKRRGVKPGGDIMIHGQPNEHFGPNDGVARAYDWTEGCMAVTNYEMQDIWEMVDVGTPIEIRP